MLCCDDQFFLYEGLRNCSVSFILLCAFFIYLKRCYKLVQVRRNTPLSRPKQIFHIRHVFGPRTQNFNKFSLINCSHYLGQYILILTLTTQFISSREYTSINELKLFVCHFSFRFPETDED